MIHRTNRTSLEEVVKLFKHRNRTCTRVTKTQQNRTEPRNRILPRKTLRNHPTRAKTQHSSSSSEPRTEPRTRLKTLRKHPVELGRAPATAQPERVEALLKRTKQNRTSETPKNEQSEPSTNSPFLNET